MELQLAQNQNLYDDHDYWRCDDDTIIEGEEDPEEEDLEEEDPEEEDPNEEDPEEESPKGKESENNTGSKVNP